MATVLALSSSVARGHVGLSAFVPVMQRLGHEVIALPSVVLSNHPGHEASSGFRVAVEALDGMLSALNTNGWLAAVDLVVTGYLPSAGHVAFAARALDTIEAAAGRRPTYVCDPVLGDAPYGLYIEEDAAAAVRSDLIARADVLTPNCFELGWLSGLGAIADPAAAVAAARTLPAKAVLATSVPDGDGLANVLVTEDDAWLTRVPLMAHVPHGTGDVLTAQIAARLAASGRGQELSRALASHLGASVAATALIIEKSLGAEELSLVPTAPLWERPDPLPIMRI